MKNQQGTVLIVSLIILFLVTLLGVSGMNSGILELRMSANDELRTNALQTAQSAVDETAVKTSSFIVSGMPGEVVKCTATAGCSNATLALIGPAATTTEVTISRLYPETGNPNPTRREGSEFSIEQFKAAFFQIEAENDTTATAGGRAKLVQGYMVLISNAGN